MVYMLSEDVLDLLGVLVSYNTVNDPERGVRPSRDIVDFISDWVTRKGIPAEILESGGYFSIVGFLGKEPPCIALSAHYDTVPVVRDRWTYDPFKLTIVGNRAYGRGALDDKSNIASIMVALDMLRSTELGCGVVFAFTGDEEIGGRNGAYVVARKLSESGRLPRYLINCDGMGMTPIVRRRKSFTVELVHKPSRIEVRGTVKKAKFSASYPVSQHAHAAYFIAGVDTHPLIAASVFVREANVFVRSLKGSFMKSNVVPAEVEIEYVVPDPSASLVEVDEGLTELLRAVLPLTRPRIRTRALSDYGVSATPNIYSTYDSSHRLVIDVRAMALSEDVEETYKELVSQLLPEATVTVRSDIGGYLNTSPESRLVKVLIEVLREVGHEPRPSEGAGASDSRYFTPLGVEAVDVGPTGGNMHGDDEYVDLDSLRAMPAVYYKAVRKLASEYTGASTD